MSMMIYGGIDFHPEEFIAVLHWLENTAQRYDSLFGWKVETVQSLFYYPAFCSATCKAKL